MAKTAELALILSLVDEVSKHAKQVSHALEDVGKKGNVAQQTIDRLGKIGFGILAGAAGTAATAVGGVSTALFALAKEAAPLEGIKSAFYAISDAGDEMLEALREGSAGMVSSRDLMRSYVQASQLVGKEFADNLPQAMKYLSKVSAATGEDMAFLMDSLVKGIGRVSPMILDNLGIQVDLAEATERAAQMFNKEKDALTEAEIKAGLQAVVMEKLAANTAELDDVTGSASQMLAAFGAQFRDLKDAVGLAALPMLKAVLGPLVEMAQQVMPILREKIESVLPFFERLAKGVGIFITSLAQGRGPVDAFKNLLWTILPPQLAAQVTQVVDSIAAFIGQAAAFVSEHAEAFKGALLAIGAVLAGAAIASGIAAIGGAIAALANPVTLVIAAAGLLGAAWAENWGGIREKTQAVIDWIRPYIEAALGAIRQFWAENGEAIMASVRAVWDTILSVIQTVLEWIRVAVSTVLTAIQEFWAAHGEKIMSTAQAVWEWIADKIGKYLDVIRTIFAAFSAAAHGDWEGFGEKMREATEKMWSLIKDVFGDYLRALLKLVGEAVQGIVNWFSSQDWGAIGRAIIEGIVNGVKQHIGWLADTARAAAQAAIDAAKGFLGIRSPSRVAMLEIGRPFVEGIARGIKGAEDMLHKQATATVSAVITPPPVPSRWREPQAGEHKEYHLHIHTSAPTEQIIADFRLLEALA